VVDASKQFLGVNSDKAYALVASPSWRVMSVVEAEQFCQVLE